jgi:Cu/Ag efflux protein CusF
MNQKQYGRSLLLFATMLCMLTAVAYGQQANRKQRDRTSWAGTKREGAKKEFVFKGKVEKVDPSGKAVVVTNEAILGWRLSMTMTYTVDNPEVLTTLRPGDLVRAKVYEREFNVLYGLQVIPPEDTPVFLPKK